MFELPTNFSYQRVIPRDLFNESKLLKCMGQLALLVHDGMIENVAIKATNKPFKIGLHGAGYLTTDLQITVNGEPAFFGTTYNSKNPYPLYCFVDDEEYEVFTDSGELTEEFIALTN